VHGEEMKLPGNKSSQYLKSPAGDRLYITSKKKKTPQVISQIHFITPSFINFKMAFIIH
jgi:hypothetical protein